MSSWDSVRSSVHCWVDISVVELELFVQMRFSTFLQRECDSIILPSKEYLLSLMEIMSFHMHRKTMDSFLVKGTFVINFAPKESRNTSNVGDTNIKELNRQSTIEDELI